MVGYLLGIVTGLLIVLIGTERRIKSANEIKYSFKDILKTNKASIIDTEDPLDEFMKKV